MIRPLAIVAARIVLWQAPPVDQWDVGVVITAAITLIVAIGGLSGLAALINSRTTALSKIIEGQALYIRGLEERIGKLEKARSEDFQCIEALTSKVESLEAENRSLRSEVQAMRLENATLRRIMRENGIEPH